MDDRPVNVRTDESARDFWSRVRESSEVSPEFKVKDQSFAERIKKTTPFGIQVHPFDNQRSVKEVSLLPLDVQHVAKKEEASRSSRSVERMVLQKAIEVADNNTNNNQEIIRDQEKLRKDNAVLHANLNRALRINHALTRMLYDKV
jgi:hypothetical protein